MKQLSITFSCIAIESKKKEKKKRKKKKSKIIQKKHSSILRLIFFFFVPHHYSDARSREIQFCDIGISHFGFEFNRKI